MEITTGIRPQFKPQQLEDIHRYRHAVFVEKLGWELNSHSGMENDQYDRPDTLYIIISDNFGNIGGTARLLPTTKPYLTGEIFPHLLNGVTPPCSDEIWEISRFAATDFNAEKSALTQFNSLHAEYLFLASISVAHDLGAKKLLYVSSVASERLLRRSGVNVQRAGVPHIIEGYPVSACYIDTNLQGKALERLHSMQSKMLINRLH